MHRYTNELDQVVGAPLVDWTPRERLPRTAMEGRWLRPENFDGNGRQVRKLDAR
jgi:hypothetical protein